MTSEAVEGEPNVRIDPPIVLRRRLCVLAAEAARGKRRAADVSAFLLDVERHAERLAGELASRKYTPGPGRSFRIRDPKPRSIYALPFRDRVVQHLLISETLPAVEARLAPQTFACRAGKGTHRCLLRAADLFRHRRHVLRVDVRRFFPSIDHAVLERLLNRTTPPPWRWLRARFLASPPCVERADFHFPGDDLFTPLARPHGLPIGSLTSQIWANVYLSPVDHLLASGLGIGDFVRYCDDILVFGDDPGRLRDALACIEARATALRLRLHPTKTRLHRTTDPVTFLGFVLRRRGDGVEIRLRRENVARMRGRISLLRGLYACGAVEIEEVAARLHAWLAHAKHGHTQALIASEARRWVFSRSDRV